MLGVGLFHAREASLSETGHEKRAEHFSAQGEDHESTIHLSGDE